MERYRQTIMRIKAIYEEKEKEMEIEIERLNNLIKVSPHPKLIATRDELVECLKNVREDLGK
ncbi:hypothetical protein H5203_18760 [Pseudoalteromonas sp. SG41-1]|uniref:hypothetical protein n=1 Tax=Pseudoalteromonas sp. SG41-1 TaxID=2760979 RepID=UPI0016021C82|nr:hypothetical protein [Pseudoalteromonas sp. SG41-1]MBB1507510.1 hypothetical protein [Pseudoalteromonas sp. SG41-1]